jgi:hypothetical protein
VHELKIIDPTITSSWFSPPAHISRFVSEQNLHHGSFSKISVKTLNCLLFHVYGSRRFHEPEENLVGGEFYLIRMNVGRTMPSKNRIVHTIGKILNLDKKGSNEQDLPSTQRETI